MQTCIIFNPRAGAAEQMAAFRTVLAGRSDIAFCETTRAGQAREFATEALETGYELIVAAGGDGTINEVVNGLAVDFAHARLGIIPLGTGNDLARTLVVPTDPLAALHVLTLGIERHLDLIKVETANHSTYCINVAAGGFSGQLGEVLTADLKATWGPLAYLIGATDILPNLTDYETTVSLDEKPAERIEALNIVVANGRTAASGFRVAPHANPEDHLLEVVIVRSGSMIDLAGVAARLLASNYLNSELVVYRRARKITVASRPGMWFNVDGELLTKEPLTFTVQPQALRVIVGPGYTPEPDTP